MMSDIEQRAGKIAIYGHQGQFRYDGITPFIEHPKAVVSNLKRIGIKDPRILGTGWCHDIGEETNIDLDFIAEEINPIVAQNINIFTQRGKRGEYTERIKYSGYEVQIVKLADLVHNCLTLEQLTPGGIRRKIDECKGLYLNLAEEYSPAFLRLLLRSTSPYRKKNKVYSF